VILPLLMLINHSWNIGLNQDITTGLLQNKTTQFTSAGATVGVDIYKVTKSEYAKKSFHSCR
jgi:hypothetical protein